MWNWIDKVVELKQTSRPFAIATVIKSNGSTPRDAGAKMIVTPSRKFWGTIGGGSIENEIIDASINQIIKEENSTVKISLNDNSKQICGGDTEIFIEVINTGPNLFIFGAGHVAQAICNVLDDTPFNIHLIDERQEWINHPNLKANIIKHNTNWNSFLDKFDYNPKTSFIAVMTHNHSNDKPIVKKLMAMPVKFKGMIGSKNKWETFKKEFRQEGFTAEQINQITCPIGLHNAGKSPREIAISFAAQLLAIYYNKTDL